jgi:hypothetical protein
MVKITINFTNLAKLDKSLSNVKKELIKEFPRTTMEVAENIALRMRSKVPQFSPKLVNSINVRSSGGNQYGPYMHIEMLTYGSAVDTGTKIYTRWPSSADLDAWLDANAVNPWAVLRHIYLHGTKAQPFIDESIMEEQSSVDKSLSELVRRLGFKLWG